MKTNISVKLKQILSEYGDTGLSTDGTIFYCKIYEVKVGAEKRSTMEKHVNRKRCLQVIGEIKMYQMLLGHCRSAISTNSLFYEELYEVFVSANILFHKFNNDVVQGSLQKYTEKSITDYSTVRKNYIATTLSTRNEIWVSIEEKTEAQGQ